MIDDAGATLVTPRTIEGITPEWLTEALSQHHPSVAIESIQIDDVTWGFAGKVRVRPKYRLGCSAGLPETLIVKGHLQAHALGNSFAHEVEMRAYRDVVHTLDVKAPICFFAGGNGTTDSGGAFVIIEDLKPRRVKFLNALQPLDYSQAAAFLDTVARIHARYWDSAEIGPEGRFAWLASNSELAQKRDAMISASVRAEIWNTVFELPRGAALPRRLLEQHRVEAGLSRLREFLDTLPRCLIHGDEHLGNLYLEPNGEPGYYDWTPVAGHWCTSMTYFLVLALDILDRREWERSLVAHYLNRLRAYGVEAPGFDDAWKAYQLSIVFPLLVWAVNPAKFQPETIATANLSRAAWAAYDLDALPK